MNLIIHTDGGSRGNPGKAAIGVVILNAENSQTVDELKNTIGIATNNEAEYKAILRSLEWTQATHNFELERITWKLDSKLVVEQLNKNWKIKEPRMMELAKKCWSILDSLSVPHSITYVPRAENASADALVNQALDADVS